MSTSPGIPIITNSFSTGQVSGANHVGGLLGYDNNAFIISSSYSTGSISGNNFVGGLVGFSGNGTAGNGIYNSYSLSTVTGNTDVGGIYGEINGGSPDVQYTYAAGLISGSSNLGGISGLDNGTGVYLACFFDHTVNSGLVGVASGSNMGYNGTAILGDITTQMQTPSTFTGVGWSTSIWNLVSGSYPSLWR
jgi:hypothetical protein